MIFSYAGTITKAPQNINTRSAELYTDAYCGASNCTRQAGKFRRTAPQVDSGMFADGKSFVFQVTALTGQETVLLFYYIQIVSMNNAPFAHA